MANRALANKRQRAIREYRDAARLEGDKYRFQAADRGEIGKASVPAYDGAMVRQWTDEKVVEARGLSAGKDVGRCGKANRVAARNTYGNGTRKMGVDLMDCIGKARPQFMLIRG